jgi:hypothetical protein
LPLSYRFKFVYCWNNAMLIKKNKVILIEACFCKNQVL